MGEKVQVGSLTYNVLEAEWKTDLGTDSRAPKHRYLVIRLLTTNNGKAAVSIPSLTLEGPNQASYPEVSEGLAELKDWLGILRNIEPFQTERGSIVFDAPMSAYSLQLSDAGEPGQSASVIIPVQLD